MATLGWIDNHCHLDGRPDVAEVVAGAVESGVVGIITVGVTVERSRACIALAQSLPALWATAGVHPHHASDGIDGLEGLLKTGKSSGSVVAVGECGLDYHYLHSPPEAQRDVFRRQIALAHGFDLPLVIHTREAWEDTFELLDEEGVPRRTVFHCFTGGEPEAAEALRRGAFLSISGIVTFPSAEELRAAVASAPLDRLMVETDSPYLAPVPFRGKPNSPSLVGLVGTEVAALQHRDPREVSLSTVAVTRSVYGLEEDPGAGAGGST